MVDLWALIPLLGVPVALKVIDKALAILFPQGKHLRFMDRFLADDAPKKEAPNEE